MDPVLIITMGLLVYLGWSWALTLKKKGCTSLYHKPETGFVSITIDDVPSDSLEEILSLLGRYGARALFFVNGSRCRPGGDDVKKIMAAGHMVGNHSFSHYFFYPVSRQVIENDLERNEELLVSLGVDSPPVRTPHGYHTCSLVRFLYERGTPFCPWDFMLWDFLPLPQWVLRRSLVRFIRRGGGVLCMHARKRSVKALAFLLDMLYPQLREDNQK